MQNFVGKTKCIAGYMKVANKLLKVIFPSSLDKIEIFLAVSFATPGTRKSLAGKKILQSTESCSLQSHIDYRSD